MTEAIRTQRLELQTQDSLRFVDPALADTGQQMLDLQTFVQSGGRRMCDRVGSNLTADIRPVYCPYAVYVRSAGERQA